MKINLDYVIAVALVILLALVGIAIVHDTEEWNEFKSAHKCKIVAHIKGDFFNTVAPTSNGVAIGIGSTPDKDGWLCDDGITYYREQ